MTPITAAIDSQNLVPLDCGRKDAMDWGRSHPIKEDRPRLGVPWLHGPCVQTTSLLPASADPLSCVRKAADGFRRSISRLDGVNQAIAYLGHAWCLAVLGEKENAMKERQLLTKIKPVPRHMEAVSGIPCIACMFAVMLLVLAGSPFFILVINALAGWTKELLIARPVKVLADGYRCDLDALPCGLTAVVT